MGKMKDIYIGLAQALENQGITIDEIKNVEIIQDDIKFEYKSKIYSIRLCDI
jgi:hypothetical protein